MDAARGGRGRRGQRAHGLEVAASLPGGGRAGSARSQLGAGLDPAPHPGGAGAGDRGAPSGAVDGLGDRRAAGDAGLDGLDDPDPARARPALEVGAAGAAESLPAGAAGRARPHRREEAGPDRPARPPRQRRPQDALARDRLGVRARLRRRRHPLGLRRGARRREGGDRGRLPPPSCRPLRRLRDPRRAGDDRQRPLLPLNRARARLPRTRAPPPPYPPLPAAHQRQGRTLHPHHARPLGLRRHLPDLSATPRRTPRLARQLQSPPTPRQPQPPNPARATPLAQEQPCWVLHPRPCPP